MESDSDADVRVAVFFSGGASALQYLAAEDPNYGELYDVVGAFTDQPDAEGVEACRSLDVPVKSNDIDAFYSERDAPMKDMDVRREFDRETLEMVDTWDADVILLSGYMRILTAPVVEEYTVVNVHPADLRFEEDGERVYTGFDPVWDAVEAGEPYTRSSVHLVTAEVDDGPLLTVSRPFEVHRDLVDALLEHGAGDAVRSYVDSHQEWMKWLGDGPAVAKALELLAEDRIDIHDEDDGKTAYVDGEEGPLVMG